MQPLLRSHVLELLANLLDYPNADLATQAAAAEQIALQATPAAAPYLRSFREYSERVSLEHLEQVYNALFDLNHVF